MEGTSYQSDGQCVYVLLDHSRSFTGQSDAAACVAKLSADGQLIFNTVRPDMSAAADSRSIARAKTIERVGAGKISQATALDAALPAASCLEFLWR